MHDPFEFAPVHPDCVDDLAEMRLRYSQLRKDLMGRWNDPFLGLAGLSECLHHLELSFMYLEKAATAPKGK